MPGEGVPEGGQLVGAAQQVLVQLSHLAPLPDLVLRRIPLDERLHRVLVREVLPCRILFPSTADTF